MELLSQLLILQQKVLSLTDKYYDNQTNNSIQDTPTIR